MGLAWGPAWMRASFFPLFLFAFAVPITGVGGPIASLTFHLRLMVTELVTFVCNTVLAIDVHRQGTQLFNGANTYSYEVAAACSGLRSLIAIFALCTIYGFMTFQKNWRRVLMMAAAIPLAVLGNMLRMLMIVIAAEIGGQSKGDYVHGSSIFSLLPYVPAILGILVMGHWLREKSTEPGLPLNPKPAQ
jgi:exosortase